MNEKKHLNNNHNPSLIAKAGLWYTICSFVFKAMAFLTTPLFARMMSKKELGSFTDFASAASIMIVISSFNFSQSIIRSKAEYEQDIDSYIWSILSLSTLWTLFLYVLFLVFPSIFINILKMESQMIHIMFWYLLTAPPYTMIITKQRAFYKYKRFALLTGIMAISGTGLSLVFVLLMQNKLMGRIIGFYSPYIIFGVVLFFYIALYGKKIKIMYWKYAIKICIPLVPHDLSLHILGVSDVLLMTRLCGEEYTAFYSIAYSAYHIATVLFDSMNKAWAPWLVDNLFTRNYKQIKKFSRLYIFVFLLINIGILLLVPEIIFALGGKQYGRAMYCMPALLISCSFLFVFTMYVNIEFYEKKTIGVSVATMIGTTVNVLLNIILLPIHPSNSYIIAAYTTLVGYIVLFAIHFCIVKRMKMDHVYDTRFVFFALILIMVVGGLMNFLYSYLILRWIVILLYTSLLLFLIFHFRGVLKQLFLSRI